VKQATQLTGIGPETAKAVISAMGDFKQFQNGSQFAAWLGVVPRQRSSGGKSVLGGITKHGQSYLRMLPIQGAKSTVMPAERSDRTSQWVLALPERAGWQKAVAALANKNAHILLAVMPEANSSMRITRASNPSNDSCTTKDEETLNRSDRRRANSTNPWWQRPRRHPRDRNGAPPSGSHLGPCARPHADRHNKAVCRVAVCSLCSTLHFKSLLLRGSPL
jgi:hypothetical protein